jgi:hypothetical protein
MAVGFARGVLNVEDGDGMRCDKGEEMGRTGRKWGYKSDAGGGGINEVPNKGKTAPWHTDPIASENKHAGCRGEREERVQWKGSGAYWVEMVKVRGREPKVVFGSRVLIGCAYHRFVLGGGKRKEGEAERKGVIGRDCDALASFAIEGARCCVPGDEPREGDSAVWIKVVNVVAGALPLV